MATIGAALVGGGAFSKDGDGTLVLSGTNDIGSTTINDGVLSVSGDAQFGTAMGQIVINSGTLDSSGSYELNANREIYLGSNTSTIRVSSGTLTYAGEIDGNTLNKVGPGTLALSGVTTFGGGLNVNEGAVSVNNNFAYGQGVVTVASGGALQISGAVSYNPIVTIAGTGVNNGGAIEKTGGGTTTFAGFITVASGGARIINDAGTLILKSAISTTDDAPVTLGGAGTITLSGQVSGTRLYKDGAGTLVLAASNVNTGGFAVNGGTLYIGTLEATGLAGSTTGNTGIVPNGADPDYFLLTNGGTIQNGNTGSGGTFIATNKGITVGAGGGALYTPATLIIDYGVVTGSGSLTKTGTGSLGFSAPWTYTGGTNANAGILVTRGNNIFPDTGNVTINANGAISFYIYSDTIGPVQGTGQLLAQTSTAGTLTINNPSNTTFSGLIGSSTTAGASTTLKITKTGTGTQVFSGINRATGTETISAGVLRYDTAGSIGGTGATVSVGASGIAGAGYAMDQGFLSRITSASAGVAALTVDSSNDLDMTGFTSLRLGAIGNITYSGNLTSNGTAYLLGGGGGTLNLTKPLTGGAALTVSGTGSTIAFAAGAGASHIGALAVSATSTLDVADNALVLSGASESSLRGLLSSGRNDVGGVGSWTGTGLVSSTAAADVNKVTGIGYLMAGDKGVSSWNGITGLATTDVITSLTYYGDINLDGTVNADDYALLDKGMAQYAAGTIPASSAVWLNGDFNYDGVVDAKDYLLADISYSKINGGLSPALLSEREAEFGSGYVGALVAAVPEPTTLSLVGMGAAMLIGRRRRNG
jgi:autotransporter-associated beta strand protein